MFARAAASPGTVPAGRPDAQGALHGRIALVTGAGSGIGAALTERFVTAGAHVHAVDLNADALEVLVARLGPAVTPWSLDLSDLAGHESLPTEVDILVNNAGIQHVEPLESFPPEMFDRILAIMLASPFRLIRATLPHMYAVGWGRVINISSVHGLRASAFKSAYVTAKHGLEGLSKVTALEGAPHGVTSNCINPAYVRTPLVEKQIEAQASTHGIEPSEVVEQVMLGPAAVKRLIEPAEVAELALFLCGPASASITGASYAMDGGWSAH